MSKLTQIMRTDRYGDDLALAFFDLALAERVNPPTDQDLGNWELMRRRDEEGLQTLLKPEPFDEQTGVFYHGTSGDWAGLPIPSPDMPGGDHQGWPTALFVSPYFGYSRYLGGFGKDPKALTRDETRVYVGGLDDERIYQPIHQPMRSPIPTHDYSGAIRWTNQQIYELGDRIAPKGEFAAIRPPYYDDYDEDKDQVLVLDPFAPRWFDLMLHYDLSARGIRELGQRQGFERIRDLDRQATLAAERMLDRTPLEELRARRWADDRRDVADVIRETRFPAIAGSVDPHADMDFALPPATQAGVSDEWLGFLDRTVQKARSADPAEREKAARRVAAVKNYLNWLVRAGQNPTVRFNRALDAVGWQIPGSPEDLRGRKIAKASWTLQFLVGNTPVKESVMQGLRLAFDATPPERKDLTSEVERQRRWAAEAPQVPNWQAYADALTEETDPPTLKLDEGNWLDRLDEIRSDRADDRKQAFAARRMIKWLKDPLHGPTNPEVRQVIDHWGWDKVWDSPDQYTPEEMQDVLDKFKRGSRPPGMDEALYVHIANRLHGHPWIYLQEAAGLPHGLAWRKDLPSDQRV